MNKQRPNRSWVPVETLKAIRRNHGIEHGVVTVLLEQGVSSPIGGNGTSGGFYIYGNVSTEQVGAAAKEALLRMRAGERELAISPHCGTNIVVAAGIAALFSFIPTWRSKSKRPKFSSFMLGALASAVMGRSLGAAVQRRFTTLAEVEEVEILSIRRFTLGPLTIHRFETSQPF